MKKLTRAVLATFTLAALAPQASADPCGGCLWSAAPVSKPATSAPLY